MDGQDAEIILPQEQWVGIFDNIQDDKDLLNVYSTCRKWKSLLYNTRPTWMFSQVFPKLFNFLAKNDILNARLVCKRWNRGVEKYLEEEQPSIQKAGRTDWISIPPLYGYARSLDVEITRATPVWQNDLSPAQALQHFETQFRPESRKNPFLSRSLILYASNNTLQLGSILHFFRLCGHHIWTLNLTVQPYIYVSSVRMATFLWLLFRYTPNLKKLILDAKVFEIHLWDQRERRALAEFLRKYPTPPRLAHLKNMHLSVNAELVKKRMLAAYTPQLSLYSECGNPQYKYESLSNLKYLTWTFQNSSDPDLKIIGNLNCPSLEHLFINLQGFRVKKNACRTSTVLFTAIENFGESLKYLNIFWREFEEIIPDRVDLPHLQEICLEFITVCPDKFSLAFLENFKKLRKVKLTFREHYYQQLTCMKQRIKRAMQLFLFYCFSPSKLTKKDVDLHNYLDAAKIIFTAVGAVNGNATRRPYNSNIWRLIPSLNVVVVKVQCGSDLSYTQTTLNTYCQVYTRQELNKRLSNKFLKRLMMR